jgi:triphosphoribosyl-dephospho-CoA synthase
MPTPSTRLMQNLGVMAQLACVWEATARKPGNVHRFADFGDLTYLEFLHSAAAIGGVLDKAWFRPIGEIVLEAIKATRHVSATNTNLGIVLLLTPLAAVVPGRELRAELPRILRNLTVADAVLVYEAIRTAQPGGMGAVQNQDIHDIPSVTLRDAMTLAEDRDRIAWQYTHDFVDVFEVGLPALKDALGRGCDLEMAIVAVHLAFMAAFRDSLIERKHGRDVAERVRVAATKLQRDGILFSDAQPTAPSSPGTPGGEGRGEGGSGPSREPQPPRASTPLTPTPLLPPVYRGERGLHALAEFDAMLRFAGSSTPADPQERGGWPLASPNRLNPGTSADLTAACLFAALREGIIPLPLDRPWSNDTAGTRHG